MYGKANASIDVPKNVRYNVHIKEVLTVLNTNATNFRRNLFGMLEQTVKFNEPINISTKDGNAVLLSEEDYNGLMETLYLCSIPGMEEKIKRGMQAPLEDCIPADEVQW